MSDYALLTFSNWTFSYNCHKDKTKKYANHYCTLFKIETDSTPIESNRIFVRNDNLSTVIIYLVRLNKNNYSNNIIIIKNTLK